MKRSTIALTLLAAAIYLAGIPVFAQRGSHRASATSHGDKNTAGKSSSTETSSQKQLTNVINSSTSSSPSKLAQKLTSMLPTAGPNAGLTLQAASAGFKNLGRFISALHAYNNLGLASKNPPVSFLTFASKANSSSLGKAIHQVQPDAASKDEANKAHHQALNDIKESESES